MVILSHTKEKWGEGVSKRLCTLVLSSVKDQGKYPVANGYKRWRVWPLATLHIVLSETVT